MKIEHLAIWVHDLENMKQFYEHYFSGQAGEKYHNPGKNFTSYFITFQEGCRLELMHNPEVSKRMENGMDQSLGIAHFAVSVGSKQRVDQLTEELRKAGYKIIGAPRTTGDGYYESVVLDPENNSIEITI